MSNIEFLSPRMSDLATIAASSQQSTLPATNLQNAQPRRVWRSSGLSNLYITWQMSAAVAANMLAVVRPNFTGAATWRLRGGATLEAMIDSPPVDTGFVSVWPVTGKPDDPAIVQHVCVLRFALLEADDHDIHVDVGSGAEELQGDIGSGAETVFASATAPSEAGDHEISVNVGAGPETLQSDAGSGAETTVVTFSAALTYWRLDIADAGNAAGYVEMGVALLGAKVTPASNFDYGGQIGDEPLDVVIPSPYGVMHTDERDNPRVVSLSWEHLEEADALGGLGALLSERKTSKPFLVCLDPDATTYAHIWTQYGSRVGPRSADLAHWQRYGLQLRHREWL